MLSKSRPTALLTAAVFAALFYVGYVLPPVGPPLEWQGAAPPPAWFYALLWLVGGGIALWFGYTIVMDTGEDSFGWRGLLRWAACGLISGLLINLWYALAILPLDEKHIIRLLFEPFSALAIFALTYWLIFRKNLMTVHQSGPPGPAGRWVSRNMSWFILIGSLLLLLTGWAMLLNARSAEVQMGGSATILFGLCGLLFSGLEFTRQRGRPAYAVLLLTLALFLAGLVVLIIAVV